MTEEAKGNAPNETNIAKNKQPMDLPSPTLFQKKKVLALDIFEGPFQ